MTEGHKFSDTVAQCSATRTDMKPHFERNDVSEPKIQRNGNIHRAPHQQPVVTA